MSDLERRDRLAEPASEPAAEQTYGEGFIAINTQDGRVVTISGIADLVEKKRDIEDFIDWYGNRRYAEATGWNVTIHFVGNIVEEHRPLDGKEETE